MKKLIHIFPFASFPRLMAFALLFLWSGCIAGKVHAQVLPVVDPYRFAVPVAPPLDLVSGAWSGYSVARKLRTAYSGSAFAVTTNGITHHNVPFLASGLIDTNDLMTYAGGSSAYVSTIYNQSGSGTATRNLTNTPALLVDKYIIVDTGVLVVDARGLPCAKAPLGVTSYCQSQDSLGTGAGTSKTFFLVFNAYNHTAGNILWCGSSTVQAVSTITFGGNKLQFDYTSSLVGPLYSINTPYVLTTQIDSVGTDFIQLNNNTAVTGNAGSSTGGQPALGYQSAAIQAGAYYSEWLIWNTSISAGDITIIQNNANSFYALF